MIVQYVVFLSCVVASPFVSRANGPVCPFGCVPGLETIGVGVDLSVFTEKAQDQIAPIKMLKQPVVNLTTTNQYTWTNPFLGNTTYGVWDQVSRLFVEARSVTESFDLKIDDAFQFQEAMNEQIDGDALFGLFSASEEASESFSLAVKTNNSLVVRSGHVDTYIAELTPPSRLQPDAFFLQSVQRLPASWWTSINYPKVVQHINNYGTHFINTISAGGDFRYVAASSSLYVDAVGDAQLNAEADLDFLFFLSASGAISGNASASNDYLSSLSYRSVECRGGNGVCNGKSQAVYDAWVASVHSTPFVTQARYTCNTDLLTLQYPKESLLLLDVTVAYLAWAGLQQLLQLLDAARSVLQTISQLPDPPCHVSGMSSSSTFTCGPKICPPLPNFPNCPAAAAGCYRTGPSGDPVPAIATARGNALKLLNNSADLRAKIAATLQGQAQDARIEGWLPMASNWTLAVAQVLSFAFSKPAKYSCVSSLDSYYFPYPPPLSPCCHLCCWAPGDSCSDASYSEIGQSKSLFGFTAASTGGDCHVTCDVGPSCAYDSPEIPSLLTNPM